MIRSLFLPLFVEGSLELLYRLNAIPLDFLTTLFGNHNSPLGGVVLPIDSRLVALFSRVPFLSNGHIPPASNPKCPEVWRERPFWGTRAAMKLGNSTTKSDEPFLALFEDPADLSAYSAEELACIFYLGYAPNSIPTGLAYGRVLHILGRSLFRDLGSLLWGGKIFYEMPCDGGQ
eukprot:Gregarina_sp_Pseudo_9__855@NODE_1547_length_1506_cov_8_081800_g1434_i0_p1_GENE_NODE_1547_length_1506_cov_8_081800_g1434_i0NODE_1547_length_1506_cov_8_081800_g1434_i0_p1_ORF_typecomplete_len175_score8_14_NODE_1547_length_1506_cov_8_081800_g1434_i0259783